MALDAGELFERYFCVVYLGSVGRPPVLVNGRLLCETSRSGVNIHVVSN